MLSPGVSRERQSTGDEVWPAVYATQGCLRSSSHQTTIRQAFTGGLGRRLGRRMTWESDESMLTEQERQGRSHLAASCGTYCGACPAYLSKHGEDHEARSKRQQLASSARSSGNERIPDPNWMEGLLCDGCVSGGEIPPHCRNCSIRNCAEGAPHGGNCAHCQELPCPHISALIETGLLHRGEYMKNLAKIREMGVQEWLTSEQERWRCPRCGLAMSWYDAECIRCGEARSERLFPLR